MHYTRKDIMAAGIDIGDGWTRAEIVLENGDTADSALSSKWQFAGPGTVEYLMHRSGWHITPTDVRKQYI